MAQDYTISLPVRQLVQRCIASSTTLETLLLLSGSFPTTSASKSGQVWSAAEVSAELRSERTLIASVLANLQQANLLEADTDSGSTCYRFAPKSDRDRDAVATLATLYRERRHSVLALIYEHSS